MFDRRGGRRTKGRGGGAPQGAWCLARTPLRDVRDPAAGDCDLARARLRHALRLVALQHGSCRCRPRFASALSREARRQRAPRGPVVVPAGRGAASPGARLRASRAGPSQPMSGLPDIGPHKRLLRLWNVFRKTPLDERGDGNIITIQPKSNAKSAKFNNARKTQREG